MGIKVTYKAASMEVLADHLREMATDKRHEAATVTRQRDQRDLRHVAEGIEIAASIVESTTIDPNVVDEDAQAEE